MAKIWPDLQHGVAKNTEKNENERFLNLSEESDFKLR